jgi:ComEC/Rec2-related protein
VKKGSKTIQHFIRKLLIKSKLYVSGKYLLVQGIYLYLKDYIQYALVIFWILGVYWGIYCSDKIGENELIYCAIMVLIVVSLIILSVIRKKRSVKQSVLLVVFLVGFVYSLVCSNFQLQKQNKNLKYALTLNGKNIDFEYRITSLPIRKSGLYEYLLIGKVFYNSEIQDFTFISTSPEYKPLEIGCVYKASPKFSERYYPSKGTKINGELFENHCVRKEDSMLVRFYLLISKVRNYIYDVCTKYLGEPSASLTYGILTGDSPSFSSVYNEHLRNAGVMHVVAASGFNVVILIGLANKLLNRVPNLLRILLLIVILFMYAALAGFSSSIVRACVMSVLLLLVKSIGRKNSSVLALLYTAFIFSVIDPLSILNIGFLLSFFATAGLLILLPILQVAFPKLSENLLTSVSAIIATTPVSVYFFGTFSIVGLIMNIVFVPVIESVMVLGIYGIIANLFSDVISKFLFYIIFFLLSIFNVGVNYLGRYVPLNFAELVGGGNVFIVIYLCALLVLLLTLLGKSNFENIEYYFKQS